MKDLYEIAGYSRQAHWDYMSRIEELEKRKEALVLAIKSTRELHPTIGGKKLYELIGPEFIGRDLFFDFMRGNDLLTERKRSSVKTTDSVRSHSFPNLIPGLEICGINQLWTSDITYYRIGETFFYIFFLLDVYSRRILGYHAGSDMRAESALIPLKMALETRGVEDFSFRLIHHTDQGVQYASKIYTELLEKYHVKISMSSNVLENSHVERINGTIKNGYLIPWKPRSLNELKKFLKKAVENYHDCPHWSLDFKTPLQFERLIQDIPISKRSPLRLASVVDPILYAQLRNQPSLFDQA